MAVSVFHVPPAGGADPVVPSVSRKGRAHGLASPARRLSDFAVALRDAMTVPVHLPCCSDPSFFSPHVKGFVAPILPLILPL